MHTFFGLCPLLPLFVTCAPDFGPTSTDFACHVHVRRASLKITTPKKGILDKNTACALEIQHVQPKKPRQAVGIIPSA